jgi:hypothetical protein
MQACCPAWHESLHCNAQPALGALPEQVSGEAHVEPEATYRQPLASRVQVSTEVEPLQTVPASVQIVDMQVHVALPPDVVQI